MVSKITEKIVDSMINNKNFKSGMRDRVINNNGIAEYYLFGNKYLELLNNNTIIISTNGYYTTSTSRRLNQIISLLTHNTYKIKGIKGIYYLFKDNELMVPINENYILNF
jgi:hypothetical protein